MSARSLIEPFAGPVSMATMVFPVVACVVVVPFALYHYRKHGHVHPWRAFVSYSFVYYLIAALFLVILPLPDRPSGEAEIASWNHRYGALRTPRLDPTGFIRVVVQAAPGGVRAKAVAQLVFNALLLLPFGSYLSYAFRRPLWVVPIYGLVLSLFFEVCQLTGDFGWYPGPYRLFDAGDVLLNTVGATLGGVLALLLARAGVLPRLERLKGPSDPWIRPFRRLIALGIDAGAILLSALGVGLVGELAWDVSSADKGVAAAILALFWLILLPVVDRGRGLGRRLTFCAIRAANGRQTGAPRILARQALIWGVPVAALAAASLEPDLTRSIPMAAAFSVWFVLFALDALKATFGGEHAGYADRWLGIRVRDTWSEIRPYRSRAGGPRRPARGGKRR